MRNVATFVNDSARKFIRGHLFWHRFSFADSAQWLALACVLMAALTRPLDAAPDRSLAQYATRSYKTEQGLPQNEVRSIAQTRDGYMWFGTRDGLARFDGYQFTVFRHETTPGIGHNMFGSMLVDHAGRLWIATGDGLSRYENGRFRRFTQADGLPANAVHSLFEDRAQRLWAGTWNGLAIFDGAAFRSFAGLPSKAISGIAGDQSGGLWVGTFGGGLAHITGDKVRVLTQKDGLPANFIQTVFSDRAGNLWIGTLNGSAVLSGSGDLHALPALRGKAICFYEDRDGSVWAATDHVFGRYVNRQLAAFEKQEGPSQDVETLFEDKEGSLWIGTASSGVSRYRAGAFTPYTKREGLADDKANAIFEDSKQNIWIGSVTGLTRRSKGASRTIPPGDFGGGDVRSIAEDAGGQIWVGTSQGVARFNGKVWSRMGPIEVHVLYKDRAGRMWIGSPHGITVWDRGNISKITQRDGLPGDYVMSILEDRQGTIWVGTITGLARINNGVIKSYITADGLSSNYIQCLYEDSLGSLWICTPGGLQYFHNGRFKTFTTRNGLYSDSILQLLEDDRHRFWFSSYRGIFRVNRDDLIAVVNGASTSVESIPYGIDDGMKSIACSGLGLQPAGWKAANGALWFPTSAGVVTVDPASLPPPHSSPMPLIEASLKDGVAASVASVEPRVHRIDFDFTAPTSIGPEAIHFRYKMEGFENDWHDTGGLRRISFTNLPKGSYRLLVSARRDGSPWSQDASIALRVLPHIYETGWFYAAMALLAACLIWTAHSLRVRATERRYKTILHERSRVAQELHDTLLQSVSGTAMEIRGALGLLGNGHSETGARQISVALDHLGQSMADARQAIWDLKSPETLANRLERVLESATQRLCDAGPQLNFRIVGKPCALPQSVDRNAYGIALEAVTNAVKHSGCTEIIVELHFKKDFLLLSVQDNGAGFDGGLIDTSMLFNHWGLAGMKERANDCGGRVTIETVRGAGTTIRFEAPLRRALFSK